MINLENEHRFITFMKVAAARTGRLLNYNDVARDADVSVPTVKSWISMLETSGLICLYDKPLPLTADVNIIPVGYI